MKPGDQISSASIAEAHSISVGVCSCGCGSIKLIYLDVQGKPFAMAGFTVESWNHVESEMTKALLVTAPVDTARPQ